MNGQKKKSRAEGKLEIALDTLGKMRDQLKIYMKQLEKKGMQTDPLYLDFEGQVQRFQNSVTALQADLQNIRRGKKETA